MSGFSGQVASAIAWTPTLSGTSTAGTGQTYSTNAGSYDRVGNIITAHFNIVATSLGTAAGNLKISGLPFAANASLPGGFCAITFYSVSGLAASHLGLSGYVATGSNEINIVQNGSTAADALTVAQAGASVILNGFAKYHI